MTSSESGVRIRDATAGTPPGDREVRRRKYWGAFLVTLGVAFAAAGLTFWFAWGLPETTAVNQVVLGVVVHVLFGYIVVMSGITVYRSDLAPAETLVAAKWCFGGLVFTSALVAWGRFPAIVDGGPSLQFLYELVVLGSVGAAAGVLIGVNRGQAVQNERLVAERSDQRETLVFLLQLLRHDIRNDLVAVGGYVDHLEERVTGEEERDYLARIERRTRSTRELLGTAGTIIESETGRRSAEPVDVGCVLREQLEYVDAIEGVTAEADLGEDLLVEADPLVDELFRNLLENAVEHNPTPGLTVSVATWRRGDEVEVVVEDDGVGIPASVRADVFDPEVRTADSDGDGLGLYLVRKLVDSYDGSIAVADVDPSGTRFTVRLPAM